MVDLHKKRELPIPRCPLCGHIMEESQLMLGEDPRNPGGPHIWMETWGCKYTSCQTLHTFPARIEFLEMVLGAESLEKAHRTIQRFGTI